MKLIKKNESAVPDVRKSRDPFFGWLDDFLDRDFFSSGLGLSGWNPQIDVVEKDKEIIVKADIPGLDEKDLNVELTDRTLTISGSREESKENKTENYHRTERSYGSFSRTVALPDTIDADKINAEYKKGVLTVSIPKTKESSAKKITVKG